MMQPETEHTVSVGGLQPWLGRRRQESECAGNEESVAQDAVTIFVFRRDEAGWPFVPASAHSGPESEQRSESKVLSWVPNHPASMAVPHVGRRRT
jgi:hypothetical protein